MTIGKRIKNRREELGMTQNELADRVGYTSKSTIARIESGSNQLKQTKIMEFAKALDTTPAYLIGWHDNDMQKEKLQQKPTNEQLILLYLMQLNEDGLNEAIKRIEELTQLDKYKKDDVHEN